MEQPVSTAYALLLEEDRARRVEPDGDGHRDHQWRQRNQQRYGDSNIQKPLLRAIGKIQGAACHNKRGNAAMILHRQGRHRVQFRYDDLAQNIAAFQHLRPISLSVGRAGYHHAVKVAQQRAEAMQHIGIVKVSLDASRLRIDNHHAAHIIGDGAAINNQQLRK